jgi:TRAP-type C4-dicarboxylate transport system substrate-binding protein
VEEKTGGAITVEVFPNAELGDTVDMFSGMQGGSVDMMYSGITAYPFIEGAEVFNITAMPFLWNDHDSMEMVLNSELFEPLLEEAAQNTGIRAIAIAGQAETRELSTNVPIESADDVASAGLPIRVAPSDMTIAAWTALGGQPEVIPFPDLYLSLSQGVVDAQENGFATIRSASLFEVQDYLVPINYIREVVTVFIAESIWQELPTEHQQALREAGIEAGDELTELMQSKIQEDFDFLAERMEVLEPDVDSFRAALEGAFDQFAGELWPEGLEEQIREMQGQ